jgi:hypothetical protein
LNVVFVVNVPEKTNWSTAFDGFDPPGGGVGVLDPPPPGGEKPPVNPPLDPPLEQATASPRTAATTKSKREERIL